MNKIHNEKKLFNQIKKQDQEAFIEAYDLYVNDIYRFTYFKVGSSEEAEDITSSVFLKTWNYVQHQNIDKSKSLKALMYKIARNSIIDHYRSKKAEVSIDDDGNNIDAVDERQNISKNLELSSDFEIIKDSLLQLKDEYKEIIIMRFIDELSLTEIAQILGKSKGNTRVLSHRAMEALKEIIKKDNKLTK